MLLLVGTSEGTGIEQVGRLKFYFESGVHNLVLWEEVRMNF